MGNKISAQKALGEKKDIPVAIKEVAEVVTGILIGALKAEGLNSIENCIQDGEHLFSDIKSAVSDCKGIVADFEKLATMAAVYSNPWSFTYHVGKDLIVNGVRIFKDTEASVTNYEAGKFEAMGENIGDALAELLLGGACAKQEAWRITEATNFENLNLF